VRTLTLFVPGVPLNANARGEWNMIKDRAHYKQAWWIAGLEVRRRWKQAEQTQVTARHIVTVRRRRDPTGLAERLKGPLDGLVAAGLLPDDDEDHITIVLARSVKGDVAGIEITLEAT
jgi:hypothetical protein